MNNTLSPPFFSIITPVLNDKVGLERTLKSISLQSYKNYESIVIDGGSTDGTIDIIKSNLIIKKWISEPDEGIFDAWNKGILISKGEYILILNAGDIYYKDMLHVIKQKIKEHPKKIICCDTKIVTQSGKEIGIFKANPKLLSRGMHIPHNWCAVPKVFYVELGLYKNLLYSMDFDWFNKFYSKYGASGFVTINQVHGEYLLGGHSDVFYKEGFKYNKKIIKENNKENILTGLFAEIFYIYYIAKHIIKRFIYDRH